MDVGEMLELLDERIGGLHSACRAELERLVTALLLGLICIALALQVALLVQGRWQPMTRRADLVLNLVICAALTWILAAGPIFQAAPTDQAMKGAIALIILFTLIDVGWRARRHQVQQDSQVKTLAYVGVWQVVPGCYCREVRPLTSVISGADGDSSSS